MLERDNARRRRKGLPELTLEEYKQSLEGWRGLLIVGGGVPRAGARARAGGGGSRGAGGHADRARPGGDRGGRGGVLDRRSRRVVGTLRYALDNVTVLLWLLGTRRRATGAALHGSRLG